MVLFAGLFLFSCQKISDPQNEYVNIKAFYYDFMSRQAITIKQNQVAHDYVLKALEHQDAIKLQSNLGVTFDLIEKKPDAEKSFLSALKQASSNSEKFMIEFNLGVLFGAQKRVEEALAHYQAALDINPTSIETKHNIELLIQQQQQDKKENDKKDDKDKKNDGDGKGNPKENDKDGKDDDKKNDKDKDDKDKKNDSGQQRKSSPKYKPRPFNGEQLSEGDVKKILGELSQQDQKIRSNFNKKDKHKKEDKNEKDW